MDNYSADGYSSDGYFGNGPSTDAITLINKAALLLNDVNFTRWQALELLGWLNDAQLEVATLVVNSNAVTLSKKLDAGTKQSTPADAIRIVEFVRNMGADGLTPGQAIRQVSRNVLERYYPNWSSDAASSVVYHAMYDAVDNNSVFYVWPPQPSQTQYIEIIYAQIPALITDYLPGTKITISDYYRNALLDYMLYRAFSKDSDSANQAGRSQDHYKMFMQAIGEKFAGDTNANNNVQAK